MSRKVFNQLVKLSQFDLGLGRHKSDQYGPADPYFVAEYWREYRSVIGRLMRQFGARTVRTQFRRAEKLGWSIPNPE